MTRPLKLAIIGGGPSGFYLASRLLSLFPQSHSDSLRVHIYDKLWAPHGLVRYGVAPDHPEVKNCTHKFDSAASDSRLKFFGNVKVTSNGEQGSLPLSALKKNYTHLAFASGCTEPNMHPLLPRRQGVVIPALDVVHWYTRHPSNPPPPPLHSATHVSIIGMGNVSLDVARMLLSPTSLLEKYDVPSSVLDVLMSVSGPLEAAFTTKELREMMNLPDVALEPLKEHPLPVPQTRQQSRTMDLLKKGSKAPFGSTSKTWSLDFYRSPASITSPESLSSTTTPHLLSLAHSKVDPVTKRAGILMSESGAPVTSTQPTFFPTAPFAQWYDFDQKHIKTLPGGRVSASNLDTEEPKIYASGWAATGAKGVLATTMMDAYSVADAILEDWSNLTSPSSSSDASVSSSSSPWDAPPPEIRKDVTVTTYDDWLAIDAEEVRRASTDGKERERMDWNEAKIFFEGQRYYYITIEIIE
ncbi:nucleotide-binding domain-containing protein [Gymnopus androsaceus JB14]|uniref:Nucleotide-binding domain-containing protein n=1 Tax=Gymnopus androsaceus JB14 TaxID=1447944 RepID=A0A6A4HJH5_9AGAR|nr:nucleotide-binding domain-containing protein [Gymnopus androsaceus JB14]